MRAIAAVVLLGLSTVAQAQITPRAGTGRPGTSVDSPAPVRENAIDPSGRAMSMLQAQVDDLAKRNDKLEGEVKELTSKLASLAEKYRHHTHRLTYEVVLTPSTIFGETSTPDCQPGGGTKTTGYHCPDAAP